MFAVRFITVMCASLLFSVLFAGASLSNLTKPLMWLTQFFRETRISGLWLMVGISLTSLYFIKEESILRSLAGESTCNVLGGLAMGAALCRRVNLQCARWFGHGGSPWQKSQPVMC